MLSEIIDIILQLSNYQEFVEAVGNDGRSYDKAFYGKAAVIMTRHMMRPKEDIAKLDAFVEKVESFLKEEAENEDELGDVPDEFLGSICLSEIYMI